MIILADTGLHRAQGDPDNVKICKRGQWNVRMIVETTFSMMTNVWNSKRMRHITWRGFEAHLSYLMIAFNILVNWNGLEPRRQGTHPSLHCTLHPLTLTSTNGSVW